MTMRTEHQALIVVMILVFASLFLTPDLMIAAFAMMLTFSILFPLTNVYDRRKVTGYSIQRMDPIEQGILAAMIFFTWPLMLAFTIYHQQKSGRAIEYVVENNQWMYQVWYGQRPMVMLNVFCYAELMLIFFYNFI
tara:strand:- start:629 stop:1036 length:408 start_codon:yes stop_codon:yes gene_type:complete